MTTELTELSTEWKQMMITEISQRQISLPKDFPWRLNERNTGSVTIPSHWPRRILNGVPKDRKLSLKGIPNWMPNHLTRGLPNDYRETNGHSTEATNRDGPSGPPRPYWLPNKEMLRSVNAMYKVAFREHMRAPIAVSTTTYCEVYVLDLDQWYTALADAIGPFYHPQLVTRVSHMRTNTYDNARSESSNHCPKSRQSAVANDVEIECNGRPHSTVSQQAEQVTTRHTRCDDVEIARIRTSLR